MDLDSKVMVLQAIGASVETLLGPNKSLKCYISSDPADSAILGDTIQVLEALLCTDSEGHPIGQLLYDCCREQQKSYGCGVTSLVCLCSYWAAEVLSLVNKGIPLPIIFVIFDELLTHCNTVFTSLTVSLEKFKPNLHQTSTQPVTNHTSLASTTSIVSRVKPSSKLPSHRAAKVLLLSRHFSGPASQSDEQHSRQTQRLQEEKMDRMDFDKVLEHVSYGLSHGKELAMQLAVKAVQLQWVANEGEMCYQLDDHFIFHHCVVGKDQAASEIVSGLIANVEPDMVAVLQLMVGRQLKVLVINGDCTPAWRHMGLQKVDLVTSHDPQQLYQSSNKAVWLKKCVHVLENLQVNLVVVGGMVSPLLWEYCLAAGILVLVKLNRRQLDGICRFSKATPISYVTHCSARHIGSVEMEMMESGMVYQQIRGALTTTECFSCRIKSLSHHQSLVTAVLHSRTPTSVDTLRCQFNNCLQRLKHTLNDTHILPGAGRAEAQCIHSIKHAMEQWRVDSSSHSQLSSLPAAIFRGSWMGDGGLVCEWRDAVCGAFVNGLKRYMVQVELNCRPGVGYFVAMTTVQSKIETCNEERWREEMLSWKLNVFDVKRSKRESWKRAVQLLRMVFLSTKMDIHINDMY